ncbi:hypothetical protein Taro_056294, partial [Colocasia esculenta]|nr:hypothetical protein [Colocasia esculenta]
MGEASSVDLTWSSVDTTSPFLQHSAFALKHCVDTSRRTPPFTAPPSHRWSPSAVASPPSGLPSPQLQLHAGDPPSPSVAVPLRRESHLHAGGPPSPSVATLPRLPPPPPPLTSTSHQSTSPAWPIASFLPLPPPWFLVVSALFVMAHAYGGIGLCRSLFLPPLSRSLPLPHLRSICTICTILGEGHWPTRGVTERRLPDGQQWNVSLVRGYDHFNGKSLDDVIASVPAGIDSSDWQTMCEMWTNGNER